MESIYAIDSNNGLSKNGVIPWKSKKDMQFFINMTKNNVVIMGRNTYFSIPKQHRPLKHRLNIVLTSKPYLYEDNITDKTPNLLFVANNNYQDILKDKETYHEIYNFLHKDFKIFFIGGKTIYNQFIPLCDTVWVTRIKKDHDCDLFLNYDYSKQFTAELYDEDDELAIMKYMRI